MWVDQALTPNAPVPPKAGIRWAGRGVHLEPLPMAPPGCGAGIGIPWDPQRSQRSPGIPRDPQRSPESPCGSPEIPRDSQRSTGIPRDPQRSPEIYGDPQGSTSPLCQSPADPQHSIPKSWRHRTGWRQPPAAWRDGSNLFQGFELACLPFFCFFNYW